MPDELSQLAISPLYIFMVIGSILYLTVLRKEKGCFLIFFRVCAVLYIVIYLIAMYMFIF